MSGGDAPTTDLLRASAIDTFYGQSHILRHVDFRVGAAEKLALLGRNGMGKTTLLRTLMGLVKPKKGTIRFAGKDVTSARASSIARAGIGFVPEGRGIFPNLSVEENLRFGERPGRGRGWTPAAVYDLFPRLAERRTHWGNQLSGGEQQMLSIGRALLGNPRLMLIDEATEGLAPQMRDAIWTTLRRIGEEGVAIVVVDKNLADLLDLVDRLVILAKGEVVFDGPPAELRGDPDLVRRTLGV